MNMEIATLKQRGHANTQYRVSQPTNLRLIVLGTRAKALNAKHQRPTVDSICLSACFSRPQALAVTGVLNLRVGRRTSAAAKAEQGLEGGPRFTTTVRAADEFIAIALELAAAYAVVCADQPALQVPDHPIGKRNDRLGSVAQLERGRLRSWHMGIAARREHREAREAIGGDGGACGDVSGSELGVSSFLCN
ncbi:MAG: hypothetical protein OJF50_004513 [Nitrospira sp.]|nr:hypothetical protein [Nitrospira sp.]